MTDSGVWGCGVGIYAEYFRYVCRLLQPLPCARKTVSNSVTGQVIICSNPFNKSYILAGQAFRLSSLCIAIYDLTSSLRGRVKMADPEFTILTPNAMLGYGYNSEHFWYGIEKYRPAAIIVDSGSTDGGPYKLGMKKMTCGRESYVRDL